MGLQWTKDNLGYNAFVNVSSFYGKKKNQDKCRFASVNVTFCAAFKNPLESTFQLTKGNVLLLFLFPSQCKRKTGTNLVLVHAFSRA